MRCVVPAFCLFMSACTGLSVQRDDAVYVPADHVEEIASVIGDRLHDWEMNALRAVLRINRPGRIITICSQNHLSFEVRDRFVADGMLRMIEYQISAPDSDGDAETEASLFYATRRPMAIQAFARLGAVARLYSSRSMSGGGSGFEAHITPDDGRFIHVDDASSISSWDVPVPPNRDLLAEYDGTCGADSTCFGALLSAFDEVMRIESLR